MFNDSKEAVIRETAFGKETVDVRISFEMPVGTVNEFKGHFSGAVNAVFTATGGQNLEWQRFSSVL